MANDIIKVNYDSERPTCSARELWGFLEVDTDYIHWFSRMCEYGFSEGRDFQTFLTESTGGRPSKDATITVEMAKELCMLQRNEKGKIARTYFLDLEKKWNSPEYVMARAMQMAGRKIDTLQASNLQLLQEVKELAPKAKYYDMILKNPGLITISSIAKDYGYTAPAMNSLLHEYGIQYKQGKQWLLYDDYAKSGYVGSETFDFVHKDGTPDVKPQTKWTQKGRRFIYELLKDKGILPIIEQPPFIGADRGLAS
jgi:anti-repressor protein